MKKEISNKVSGSIGIKVLFAIGLSIVFLGTAVYITQHTFSRVNETIAHLSDSNSKTTALNRIYSAFGDFERNYQSPLIANPGKATDSYFLALDTISNIIDSTIVRINFNQGERALLDSIILMIDNQNTRLLTYRMLKQNEQPLLEQNLDSLIKLIAAERVMAQPDIITTRKSTRRIPAPNDDDEEDENNDSKKSIWQRIFSGDDEKKAPVKQTKTPQIIEETYIRIDTVPLAKSDTSKEKAGALIKNIERTQARHQRRTRGVEMEILEGSARIQNYILALIRNSEEEELAEIHAESRLADDMMQTALSRMYLVLGIFAILATMLVLRIMGDLSKAKYYRRQLVEEKDRAENLGQIKERFLANMSHEIRTPLQNILGYSERMASDEKNSDARIIHQSSEHLLQIVNQVLDFSRISTGKLTLHPKNFNLSHLIEEVIASMKIQSAKKDIHLLSEVFLSVEHVFADPFRIRQILYNLLGNAIKFTDEGFVKLTAQTKLERSKIIFEFNVEDTGIGMDQTEIERLFEEFEQADTSNHAANGTGLGLSIAKALIETYNGQINVTSDQGNGSNFSVLLELEPIQENTQPEGKKSQNPQMNSILLVDDDTSILNLTKQILLDNNLKVMATSSPLDAIKIAQNHSFDIALVDFRMPEMTGAELSVELKKIHPNLPVIAVTANVMKSEPHEGSDDPFDGYLPKPFKSKDLLELLGHSNPENSSKPGRASLQKKLDTITMGDKPLQNELMDQFKKDCLQDIENIIEWNSAKDYAQLRESIHRLSGRLGFFELNELAGAFHLLESELENNTFSEKSETKLHKSIEMLQGELETF